MAEPKKLGIYRTTTYLRAVAMLLVDMIGYALLLPWTIFRRYRGSGFNANKVKRIAIVRPDGIGDLILSIPSIKTLRCAFPEAELSLFVNNWASEIASMIAEIDELVPIEAVFFKAFKRNTTISAIMNERKMLKKIGKQQRYDLAIDLRGDFFSIVLAFWLSPCYLIGRGSRGGSFLLTNKITQSEEGYVSEVLLNFNLIQKIKRCKVDSQKPLLDLPPELSIQAFFKKFGNDYICLAVAAPYETRCYPPEHWIQLIKKIGQVYENPVIVLGSKTEAQYCQGIVSQAKANIHNLAGTLSLEQTAACIARCRLFIGNDGGLIHIASAFNRPVIQLFGPASSVSFGHFGEHEYVIQKDCPYNPCAENCCRLPEKWCMHRISPEEVFDIAKKYLNLAG